MASVVPRKNKAGEIASYQVKWRAGGKRTGEWQHERFDGDEEGYEAAELFAQAVDEAGQQWPAGWVKGEGYIDAQAESAETLRYRFDNYARQSIENRTASKRYKHMRYRAMEVYVFPTFGNCDVRSTEHFSKATIGAWVNKMRTTKVRRGAEIKNMSSETLRGLHALLASVLKEAVIAEPPLRDRNPCDLTRLPKDDERGVGDDESTDEMEFMTPEEVAGLVGCFSRASDRMLVRTLYGTGLRWGEATALAAKHVRSPKAGRHEVRVTRAWKRDTGPPEVWWLGAPKTRAGRRTVEITAGLWREILDFGLGDLSSNDLVFPNGDGGRLAYSTFYDRWTAAIKEAKKRKVLPEWKHPTVHDLRHSHVAALLSDGHSLTYVQRRLGHESIKTTSDRYGHLLETAHTAAMTTLDRVLGISQGATAAGATETATVRQPPVYALRIDSATLGFWRVEDAEETAERWARDRGGPVLVEKWSADQWAQSGNGELGGVRAGLPARAFIWQAGPARYAVDGTETVSATTVHEPRGGWAWDWELEFTDEPAHGAAEWLRGGGGTETEARAWGADKDAVVAAYASARADALRICGLHPNRSAVGREPMS
ncbi:tyrosine-type recombinase/integrase [Streptomyces sp. NPDC001068]|uniref:tyrosine-type recombinase/integrase n=1 Tax=Streptomyces sp. NPDC001068 TaxID=3364544 RepID=UPI0036BA2CFC